MRLGRLTATPPDMDKRLRVLFVPTTNAGVTYWRMLNYAAAAHRLGLGDLHLLWWQKDLTEAHPWENEIRDPQYCWRVTRELQEWALQSDAIVIQMLHTNDGMALLEALRDMLPNTPILAEIDDHMTSTAEYNPAADYYRPGSELRRIAVEQFTKSDGIVVSTPYLKEVYSEFNKNIWVIPNAIDLQKWGRLRRRSRPGIRIGWAGGASHEDDLAIVKDIVPRILDKFPDVTFVFVNGIPAWAKKLPAERVELVRKWTRIDHYPAMLAGLGLDIGIAPLVDNAFNRGKSNLRWLEYSALGIPCVASNVGHFAETIVHGEDGFLADDAEGFYTYISDVIANRKLRCAMGAKAADRIRRDFTTDVVTPYYISCLREAIAKKQQESPAEVMQ